MKPEETPEIVPEKEINERLRELELLVQYQEVEKQLVREEGRREGIKYIIEVAGVVVAILVAVGIAAIWRNTVTTTQAYQERILYEMNATLETRYQQTNSIIETRTFSQEGTRTAVVATRTFSQEGTRAGVVATRTFQQEATRAEAMAIRADEEVKALAAEVSLQTEIISDTVGALNKEIPTLVYNEVDQLLEPAALQDVAIQVIQTRVDVAVQDSFSETVKLAVGATTQAMFITATAEATRQETPTPLAMPTP